MSQGKRPRERPGHTWEDITMDLKEIGRQDLVNVVMSLQVA
jgi:hypothetical protein